MGELVERMQLLLKWANEPIESVQQFAEIQQEDFTTKIAEFMELVSHYQQDSGNLNRVLKTLLPVFDSKEISRVAILAWVAGCLVEWGGNATITIDSLLDRLEVVLPDARRFAAAIEDTLGIEPENAAKEDLTHFGEADLAGFKSWLTLHHMIMPAMTMLVSDVSLRKRARQRKTLLQELDRLEAVHQYANYLYQLLEMVDDLSVLVLHVQEKKGFQVRIQAIQNNWHFFTLLGCVLTGKKHLAGEKPHRNLCRMALGEWFPDSLESIPSWPTPWMEKPWFAVLNRFDAKSSLFAKVRRVSARSQFECASGLFIGGEHKPTEIPSFAGTPVALLDEGPGMRRILGGNTFTPIHANLRSELTIERVLSPGETDQILTQMAQVVAQDTRFRGLDGCAICSVEVPAYPT